MQLHTSARLSVITLAIISQVHAVNVNINGVITAPLQNALGENLPDGSLVEIGYFLGVDLSTDVTGFTANNIWDTFTVLRLSETGTQFNFFDAGASLTGTAFDSDNDFDALPRRVGVRITDSATGDFNIYTINSSATELELPIGTPPAFGTGEADLSIDADTQNVVWLGTPFLTDVTAIPEPSTSLSALLGLGLLIGARRRN